VPSIGSLAKVGGSVASGVAQKSSIGLDMVKFALASEAIKTIKPNTATIYAFLCLAVSVYMWYYRNASEFLFHLIIQIFFLVLALGLLGREKNVALSIVTVFSWQVSFLFALSMANNSFMSVFSYAHLLYYFGAGMLAVLVLVFIISGGIGVAINEGVGASLHYVKEIILVMLVPFLVVGGLVGGLIYTGTQHVFVDFVIQYNGPMEALHSLAILIVTNFWVLWGFHIGAKGDHAFIAKTALTIIYGSIAFLVLLGLLNSGFAQELEGYRIAGVDQRTNIQIVIGELWGGVKKGYNQTMEIKNDVNNDWQRIRDPNFKIDTENTGTTGAVGVVVTNPQPIQYSSIDSSVTLTSRVFAQNMKKPIDVSLGCRLTNSFSDFDIPGTVSDPILQVSPLRSGTLRCTFEEDQYINLRSAVTVESFAEYRAVSSGYTERYFVSGSRFAQQTQQDEMSVDYIYNYFQIPEQNKIPASVPTPGPIEVIVGIPDGLHLVDGINDLFSLWIKVNNGYDGEVLGTITDLHNLYFHIPKGLQIRSKQGVLDCSKRVVKMPPDECLALCEPGNQRCVEDCDFFDVYALNEPVNNYPLHFDCMLQPTSERALLNDEIIAIKSFGATVDYTYRSSLFTPVTFDFAIEQDPGEVTDLFTDKDISVMFDEDARQEFTSMQEIYLGALANYDWSSITDPTARYIAQALFIFMYKEHKGDEAFCEYGYNNAGLFALDKSEVFPDGCNAPAALDGNAQIEKMGQMLMQLGVDCDSVECIVGRVHCDSSFVYNNMNSCADSGVCLWCHNSVLPAVITYAQKIYEVST
jgi:hypothetical protein